MDVSDSSGAGPAATERKLVAVLACEISAPTTAREEPALDWRVRQVADSLSRVEAEVARHGGTVDMLASRWLEAAQAFVIGDKRQAADIYAAIGSRPDEAFRTPPGGSTTPDAGQTVEASTELALAFAFYRQVRASAHLADAEELLATMLSSN